MTVPAVRMKADREHRVPLSSRAVEILKALPREGDHVFIGEKPGKPLSNMPSWLSWTVWVGRCDYTRVSEHVPGLGRGDHGLSVRGGRDGSGARRSRQGEAAYRRWAISLRNRAV
jgi:integrase